MDVARLLRQTILVGVVEQDGAPDDMGDPTETVTWSSWKGYTWQQSTSDASTANAETTGERRMLALHRDAVGAIGSADRVIVDGMLSAGSPVPGVGITFDVIGEPWPALNPRTDRVEYVQVEIGRSS